PCCSALHVDSIHLFFSHLFALRCSPSLFFFHDTAPTEIYTLSLHDALPIYTPAATRDHAAALPRPQIAQSLSTFRPSAWTRRIPRAVHPESKIPGAATAQSCGKISACRKRVLECPDITRALATRR